MASSPVSAHTDPTGSTPASGAVLAKAPNEISLTFAEPVSAETSILTLTVEILPSWVTTLETTARGDGTIRGSIPKGAIPNAPAGTAPVTRRSGSSIRGEHSSRRGNRVLKRALFLLAFAALRDPVSRAYYDRKIRQDKRHNQALIALARRRCGVLYAMLRDGCLYQANHVLAA